MYSGSKKIKYSGINLPKHVQECCMLKTANADTEIKEDLNKWRGILCSWTGICSIVMMSVLPKLIYRFNAILINTPAESL